MNSKKTKLELTWIGKEKRPRLEPRILLEDNEMSYCAKKRVKENDLFDNRLIYGDNLLALKALEQEFTGKVKCVYIDPPFNTQNAFEYYDDGVEHSLWLSLMRDRIEIIHRLLRNDGAFFIHLDDNEVDYCKVLLDEIFGRRNFMNRITVDSRSPSAFSTVNPGVFKASEYILFYAKDRSLLVENPLRTERIPDYAYNQFIINIEAPYEEWKYINVSEAYSQNAQSQSKKPQTILTDYHRFIIANAHRIFRFTSISDTGAGKAVVDLKYISKQNPDKIYKMERDNFDDVYVLNGQQISFYSKNIANIDGKQCASMILTDIWSDIAWEGIAKEGGVQFKKGKKPEKLLKRCLELVTSPGDIVLDSFLGSGTTAAVAHKMGRRWIGIELGDHCHSHCIPRLRRVIDGEDLSGITKSVDWRGGGGFRYFKLAPSLIVTDEFGFQIFNPKYNAEALAEAVCKVEGFVYDPDPDVYWKQGRGTENSFVYVTTQTLTRAAFEHLSYQVGKASLAIYCGGISGNVSDLTNLSVYKIPESILSRCEWGHDDYSLAVSNLPLASEVETFAVPSPKRSKRKPSSPDQGLLF